MPWSTLSKKSHGIPSSPRAAAVAKFRLLTGHDCLCAHLFRFNLVTSPICVLCDTGQDMTAAHLDECSALNDLNCIVKRNLAKENGETQQANTNDENMQDLDDQQPSEKDIVQPEDISKAPTEKCLENVGFEFEKYVDVGSWPKSLNKQLQEQLRKDTKYYHNVIKRVIAVVKYLAIRDLAFRGTEEVLGSPSNEFLETNGFGWNGLLDNCREQSFDKAASMSSRYNGVQAVLKENK
ncbi:uncharacterized protein TNCV_176491 [Trichonephila clavipes]|nr:uncharacterized protein TNCV_176491 [Trichonephila clavipes]